MSGVLVAPVTLPGELVELRPYRPEHLDALLELRLRNRTFLAPFEPARPESFFTRQGQGAFIETAIADWEADRNYYFGVFAAGTDALVGHVSVSNVARGALQNATIGYFIDRSNNDRGFGTDAVHLATGFAFEHAWLHRVQAGVMPHNKASIRILEKAGYRYEGRALRYLELNGVWEDHDMFAITKEEWSRSR